MDALHLSYDDVVYKIPFRVLLIMQKDKAHVTYGDKVSTISGKDMLKKKRAKKNNPPN